MSEKLGVSKKRVRKLVRIWQKRLKRLGLDRQEITVIFVDQCPHEDDDVCLAETKANKNYDRARIWIYLDQLERYSERDVEVTIIHELIHVAHKGVEKSISLLESSLTGDQQEIFAAAFEMQTERFVDRLAYALLDLIDHND